MTSPAEALSAAWEGRGRCEEWTTTRTTQGTEGAQGGRRRVMGRTAGSWCNCNDPDGKGCKRRTYGKGEGGREPLPLYRSACDPLSHTMLSDCDNRGITWGVGRQREQTVM
jgi:hypothetical protein